MLKVKYFTLFKQKKRKKAGILTKDERKLNQAPLDFFLLPSVAFWLDFNQNLVFYRMQVILGR